MRATAFRRRTSKTEGAPRRRRHRWRPVEGLYEDLVARFGEVCRLCGNGPRKRRLHIDHDHQTLKVRGLLCFRCNRVLSAYVTPAWLRKAAWYLETTT